MYADPRHKNRNETKVRLDDEYESFLENLATIHRTQKAVLAREILKSWIDEKREELTRIITAV